jgi:pimeloyl-ACP methyl ester carboxylesterase
VGASAEELVMTLDGALSEVDRRAVTGPLCEFIVRETAHSLSTGVCGWFDDDKAILGDWGFELTGIRAPLHLWHGAHDRFVPIAHGAWLAGRLQVNCHMRPNDGHLSLSLSSYGEILDALLERGGG